MATIAILGRAGETAAGVALVTLQRVVSTGKRERSFTVIEDGVGPVDRAVTEGTIKREACLHVIGIGGCFEIRKMAAIAIAGSRFEIGRGVALAARY